MVRILLYECPYCNGEFNISNLIDHIKIEHPNWDTMPGLCPVCDRGIDNDMVPHLESMHRQRSTNNEPQQRRNSLKEVMDEIYHSLPSGPSSSNSISWRPNPSFRFGNVNPQPAPSSFAASSSRSPNPLSPSVSFPWRPNVPTLRSGCVASPSSFVVSSSRGSVPFSRRALESTGIWRSLMGELIKEEYSSNESTTRNVRQHPVSEEEYTEQTNRSEFVQQLLISNIFKDDDGDGDEDEPESSENVAAPASQTSSATDTQTSDSNLHGDDTQKDS